jgi:polysaccharide biosynthesis/export protein
VRHIPISWGASLFGLMLSLSYTQNSSAQVNSRDIRSQFQPSPQPAKANVDMQPAGAANPGGDEPVSRSPEGGTTSQYLIGPGDTLQVFVWQNPDLSATVPVRPDGKISTPLVEDLVAVGKTPAQLARDMETVLGEYVRNPKVNVIVSGAQSSFNQVKVIGQVKTPESIAFREGMTVLDLVLHAGGLTDFAAGNRAKLVRPNGRGKENERRIKLDDLVRKGKLSENVLLQPGDVLIVPESRF